MSSSISFTCSHDMQNFGPLTAEIGSGVCGTPTNFNGFCALPSLLQQRRSMETNQTLHDVWPYHVYWQRYCTALQQRALAKLCSVERGMELQNFRSGRRLYSAGRPSHWASADILVCNLLRHISRLSTVTVAFHVKRRLLTLFPVLP